MRRYEPGNCTWHQGKTSHIRIWLKKVAFEWWGAAKNTLEPNIIVMDFLTQALHQRAVHYVLFGAICTAFSFDARRGASYYTAAGVCLLDTYDCARESMCVFVAGERTDVIFVNHYISNLFKSLSTYSMWPQCRKGHGCQDDYRVGKWL